MNLINTAGEKREKSLQNLISLKFAIKNSSIELIFFIKNMIISNSFKSEIRVIYAFYPNQSKVEFLEIYFKEKNDSDMDYEFISKFRK